MGGLAVMAATVSPMELLSSEKPKIDADEDVMKASLHVKFLGTGAADWHGPDKRGENRRYSSILLENAVLIDYTPGCRDMIPQQVYPSTVFYTHSHGDHYNPKAALELGITKVFVGESWIGRCRRDFSVVAESAGLQMPDIHPVSIGQRVHSEGVTITALPANHITSDLAEDTLIYLVEKGPVRLLYATDTGGIMGKAARIAGIDAHDKNGRPITALIMEATMGLGHDIDYRTFSHSSVDTVRRTVEILTETKRYIPSSGQSVYLTHLARTLHGTQAELDRDLPSPLKAAYDGLEIDFIA